MNNKHHSSIRLPPEVWEKIDALRSALPGNVSRNTWIAMAIHEKLGRETDSTATEK